MKIENEWIQLQKYIEQVHGARDSDKEVAKINDEMEKLRLEKDKIIATYEMETEEPLNRLSEINKEFLSMYDGQKTLPLDVLTLTFRDTKSFKVLDKGAIVDTLMKINQVEKGVKNFALKHLRALAEADVLPAESYEWDVKLNVSVQEREE